MNTVLFIYLLGYLIYFAYGFYFLFKDNKHRHYKSINVIIICGILMLILSLLSWFGILHELYLYFKHIKYEKEKKKS